MARVPQPTDDAPEVPAAPGSHPTSASPSRAADEALVASASDTATGPFAPIPQALPPAPDGHVYAAGLDQRMHARPRTRDELVERLLGRTAILLEATRRDRVTAWLWALAVTAFAGVLRFWDLGRPHSLVFDETYYVKDAWSLWQRGYEADWGQDPNPSFEAGEDSQLGTNPAYVVHPQVGKWLIGLGMRLGGGMESSTAWRLTVAVLGTLAVLMVCRIGRRIFASTWWGLVAAVFLAVDGVAITLSRTSLLDPVLMFFLLAAFGALLLDRDQARQRLADRTAALLAGGAELGWGPSLGMRWWRLAAGVLLGLALGTKWSAMYFIAVFGVLSVLWDMAARRLVGVRNWVGAGVVKDGLVAFVVLVGTSFVVYVASWWSWFTHSDAWGRNWAEQNPGQGLTFLPPALRSLAEYHRSMWQFHTHLDTPHTYQANPFGWVLQWRPTSFYWDDTLKDLTPDASRQLCGADRCSSAVLALGNPVLWWAAAAAILVAVYWLVRYRDWRAGAVLSGILAGWVPWFFYQDRTIFAFYSVAFVPWIALTLTYVLVLIVGPPTLPWRARRPAVIGVGVFVALVVGIGLWFYPIWSAMPIPYDAWHARMWLNRWI